MEFPICKICLKNDILCPTCTDLVKRENISDDEVKSYRELNKFLKGEEHLKDVAIKRVLGNKDFLLIVTSKDGVSKIIGKNGIIAKKLSKNIKKQIRVISDASSIEELAKEVLFSSTILGINVLYTPNNKKYRIRVSNSDRIFLPVEPDTFSSIAHSIFKDDVELVFE